MKNNVVDYAIEAKIWEKTPNHRIQIALKTSGGRMFVDARKWFKWEGSDTWTPTAKGIMLELKDWDKILPMIHEMVDNAKSVDNNSQSSNVDISQQFESVDKIPQNDDNNLQCVDMNPHSVDNGLHGDEKREEAPHPVGGELGWGG